MYQQKVIASGGPGGGRGRRLLSRFHRMLGLACVLYVLMASATGSLLLFRADILALVHHELRQAPPDPIERAEALARMLPQGSFRSIRMPDDSLRAFVVYLPDNRTRLHDPLTLEPVPDAFGVNRLLDIVFELHHYLLAGETGLIISGIFGLSIILLVLIGIYLWWWPWRRRWSLSHALPRKPTRTWRLYSHHTLGILMAPGLLIASVTGSAIVFHEQTRSALTTLFGEAPAIFATDDRGSLAQVARRQFPSAVPRILIPPGKTGEPLSLRVRTAGELHPNGRSSLKYDQASGRVTEVFVEPRSGAGNRIFNLLYPLHIGSIGGLPLRLVWFASAVLAFVSAWFGFRSWWARRTTY